MLPESYQNQLKSQLDQPSYLLLSILIHLIQSFKTVSVEKLATALEIPILFESRRRKIQRFLLLPELSLDYLWLPIIKIWIASTLTTKQIYYLAIDRTSWGTINLLVISIIWNKRAIPIYFIRLNKLGSSNFSEQQQIISKIIPLFLVYKICILGDREFCSVKLANWLRLKNLYFALRLKKSHYIDKQGEICAQLKSLGLTPGVSMFINEVKVTKTQGFSTFNLAAKWAKTIKGKRPKEGWFILTNFQQLDLAISAYKQRFAIEEMFRDIKKGGYNLESTQVKGERLTALIILICLAYLSATLSGQVIKHQGYQKYLGRVNENGRNVRRHSSFYLGSIANMWVNVDPNHSAPIDNLLRLTLNKIRFYRSGERARNLILARL